MMYQVFPWCDLHVKGMNISIIYARENNKRDVRYESRGKKKGIQSVDGRW